MLSGRFKGSRRPTQGAILYSYVHIHLLSSAFWPTGAKDSNAYSTKLFFVKFKVLDPPSCMAKSSTKMLLICIEPGPAAQNLDIRFYIHASDINYTHKK